MHYCGSVTPAEFISVGHLVEVSFVTDAVRIGRGFSLTYQVAGTGSLVEARVVVCISDG